jgi:hypothetical protein
MAWIFPLSAPLTPVHTPFPGSSGRDTGTGMGHGGRVVCRRLQKPAWSYPTTGHRDWERYRGTPGLQRSVVVIHAEQHAFGVDLGA